MVGMFKEFLLVDEIGSVLAEYDLAEAALVRPTKDNQAFIDPKTGKNWRYADRIRRLQAIIKQQARLGVNPGRIWVSFSDVPRLGYRIQIKSGKSTPVGVFGYPATYVIRKEGVVETFRDRPYMLVLRLKGNHGEVGVKQGDYKWNDIKGDYDVTNAEKPRYGVEKKLQDLRNKFQIKSGSENTPPSKVQKLYYELYTNLRNWVTNDGKYDLSDEETVDRHRIERTVEEIVGKAKDKLREMLKTKDPHAPWDSEPDYAKNMESIDLDDLYDPKAYYEQMQAQADRKLSRKKDYYDYYNGYDYQNCIKNIQLNGDSPDEVAIEVEPDYLKWWVQKLGGEEEFEAQKGVKPNQLIMTPKEFFRVYGYDEVPEDFQETLDDYFNAKKKVREGASFPPMVQKFVDEWKEMVKEYFKEYLAKKRSPEEPTELQLLPEYPKLKAIATQYDLDLAQAVKMAFDNNVIRSGQQAIYRVAEALAKQAQQKLGRQHYHALWNKFLRSIGWHSAMDTKHSSGIHGAEPTQGVFIDLREVQLIAIIDNRSHVDQRDPSGRPTPDDWQYSGEHSRLNRNIGMQRQGPLGNNWEFPSGISNLGGLDRTVKALTLRLDGLLVSLKDQFFSPYTNTDNRSNFLTRAIKLATTAIRTAQFQMDRQQRLGTTKKSPVEDDLWKKLEELQRYVDDVVPQSYRLAPLNQQQLLQLQDILNMSPVAGTRYGPKASKKFVAPSQAWNKMAND